MKRLLSWLLALVMIITCLPLSVLPAFATEIPGVDTGSEPSTEGEIALPDVEASDLWATTAETTEPTEPEDPTLVLGTNNVSLVAGDADGETWTFTAEKDMTLTVDLTSLEHDWMGEGTYETVAGMGLFMTYQFVVNGTNILNTGYTSTQVEVKTGDEVTITLISNYGYAANAEITLAEHVPPVALALGENAVEVGNYVYTAGQNGAVTIALTAATVVEADQTMDISAYLAQQISRGTITLIVDGVQISASSTSVNVYAGQEVAVEIQSTLEGFAGILTLTYEAPGSSANNAASIDWVEGDGVYTATVTVPANTTYYYSAYYAVVYDFSIVETAVYEIDSERYQLIITNESDADATYNLVAAIPAGDYSNPVVIGDMNDYSDTVSNKNEYYYTWTAKEEGTVTLDINDGFNINVTHTYVDEGEELQDYYDLVAWNDTFTEQIVQENLTIEVAEGDVFAICVTDRDTEDEVTSFTLTGDFEEVVVAPEYNVTTSAFGLALDAELIVSCKFLLPDALKQDPGATIKVQFIDETVEYNVVEYIAQNGVDGKGRIKIGQSVKSFWMTHRVTVTITDGNGYTANFTDYFGEAHTGSYEFGVDEYVKTMAAAGEPTINAVRALLTYGSYSQIHFKGEGTEFITDELATEILTRNGYQPVDISGFSRDMLNQTTVKDESFDGISIRGGTPDLAAAIFMKVQFNASDLDSEADMANYSYKLNYKSGTTSFEEEIVPTFDAARKRLVFIVEGIPAMLFDEMYSITITKNETGETYTGSTSILCYLGEAYDVFNAQATYDADMLNLIKAMYYYNQAANTLFGK